MDQVGNLLARPRLYYNVDGLGELGGSAMCLAFAFLMWPPMHSSAEPVLHWVPLFALVSLGWLIRRGTNAVKTRITYPRTGFVEYRRQFHTSALAATLGALTSAGLVVSFRRHWDISALVSVAGLVFAMVYGYNFARAVRWKWLIAAAMAVASLAIALLPADVLGALSSHSPVAHTDRARLDGTILLSLLAYGMLLLISGGISFWRYVRHTPAPAQEGQ
jgi:hypothetical protein